MVGRTLNAKIYTLKNYLEKQGLQTEIKLQPQNNLKILVNPSATLSKIPLTKGT